ncbi:MAG: 30S ribosomal protein S20 [Anaerolineales bacterium]|nr:30S ribosomal protein S20 [Anaerolineales bacterium]
MANLESSKKRNRQNIKRRAQNRVHLTRSRTYIKKAHEALAAGEYEAAETAVLLASSELDHAAAKGVIHKNNAARRKSRLMKHLEALRSS